MYLVTWTGLTSGSFMGRDDGYPETKMAIVSPKDMYRYMSHRDVKVFTISQINARMFLMYLCKLKKIVLNGIKMPYKLRKIN